MLPIKVSRIPDGAGPPVVSDSEEEILNRTSDHNNSIESPTDERKRLIE